MKPRVGNNKKQKRQKKKLSQRESKETESFVKTFI